MKARVSIDRFNARLMCAIGLMLPMLASAQVARKPIPIRTIAAPVHSATDSLGSSLVVRGLSDGRVLVSDAVSARLVLFDAELKRGTAVLQFSRDQFSRTLIAYRGDSTIMVDPKAKSLVVFDGAGAIGRTMALPRTQDISILAWSATGAPAIDPQGRLVYQGTTPMRMPPPTAKFRIPTQSDSAPIVRADFEQRTTDTIAQFKSSTVNKFVIAEDASGEPIGVNRINPFGASQVWCALPNGMIAILDPFDYHIDWIAADGTRRASPRMAYDWVRISDADKQKKIDSLKPQFELDVAKAPKETWVSSPSGQLKIKMRFELVRADEIADYEPALGPNAELLADFDNRIWVLPMRSFNSSAEGLLYDVINTNGEVVERVRLPKGRVLVGFGANKAIYMIRFEGSVRFLEVAK